MTQPLRHAVGSLMVVGLAGGELSAIERAWLKLVRPGGVILFRRNIESAAQTRALLDEATGLCAPHAFRCVDMEGGTVDRLRSALTPTPSAQTVFLAARQMKEPALPRQLGELVASACQAFGFNTTLAPVLDLGLPASAAVMGTRAAAATAEGVVEFARAFLSGLKARGVVGCGKHFPGLGGGTLDSHLETPAIDRSLPTLQREDLVPYRELNHELHMVMVNHAAYPHTPGKQRPASASPYWITTVLRKQLGFRGIVFSDDLEMGGILKFMPIEEAAIAALRAGMDLIEICHSPELILRAYQALLAEAERSAAFRKIIAERAQRTARARQQLFAKGTPPALSMRQFQSLCTRMERFNAVVQIAQSSPAGNEINQEAGSL
jgi:beta-N-acetylhexosaminidase